MAVIRGPASSGRGPIQALVSADGAAAVAAGRRQEDALELVGALFAVVWLRREPGYSVQPVVELLIDLSIIPLLVVVPSRLDSVLPLHLP